jgi:hypothetical protein
VPCIFGRVYALDLFNASFVKGESVKLEWFLISFGLSLFL